jgi:hypothetical protein
VSGTQYKLLETKYFLERMEEMTSSDREAFNFNLSAFLSAARSVRFFLNREFRGADGFANWWKGKGRDWPKPENGLKEIEDPVRAANAFFWNARNITIHEGIIQPTADFGVFRGILVDYERTDDGQLVPVFRDLRNEEPAANGATPENPKYYFVDFRDKDVLTLSREYLARLEALVAEAERKFG